MIARLTDRAHQLAQPVDHLLYGHAELADLTLAHAPQPDPQVTGADLVGGRRDHADRPTDLPRDPAAGHDNADQRSEQGNHDTVPNRPARRPQEIVGLLLRHPVNYGPAPAEGGADRADDHLPVGAGRAHERARLERSRVRVRPQQMVLMRIADEQATLVQQLHITPTLGQLCQGTLQSPQAKHGAQDAHRCLILLPHGQGRGEHDGARHLVRCHLGQPARSGECIRPPWLIVLLQAATAGRPACGDDQSMSVGDDEFREL